MTARSESKARIQAREAVVRRWDAGEDINALAVEQGVTAARIREWRQAALRRQGRGRGGEKISPIRSRAAPNMPKRHHIPKTFRAPNGSGAQMVDPVKVVAMLEAGEYPSALARYLGITPAAITHIIRKHAPHLLGRRTPHYTQRLNDVR